MLVNNLAKIKEYIQATAGFTFGQIEQHLLKAQQSTLTRIFGAVIGTMETKWNNGAPAIALTADETTLLKLLQTAQANFGYAMALPFLSVQNTSSGSAQAESQTNKPLWKWQKLEIEDAALENAWEAVESAILFLISKRDDFATWKDSDQEKMQLSFFINTATDFQNYYGIGYSRRTFEAVKSSMMDAEQSYLKDNLGLALFNSIKAEVLAREISEANAVILPIIKRAVVNIAMAKAIYKTDFRFDENGARLVSADSRGSDTSRVKTPGDATTKRDNSASFMLSGETYLKELKQYLEDNAITYPLYVPTTDVQFDNSTGASVLL